MAELSQEEQAELQGLESEFALSESEESELVGLEAEYGTSAESTPTEVPEGSGINMDAVSGGIVEGVPFLKDAIAGYDAAKEAITNDTEEGLGEVYDNYKQNLQDVNNTLNVLEESYPASFAIGDIGAGISTLGLGAGAKGATVIGAASGLSRSEERTLSDAVAGGTVGAAFHYLGVFGTKAAKWFLGKEAASLGKTTVGGINKAHLKIINKHLQQTGQTTPEFVDSLIRNKVIQTGHGIEDMLENTVIARRDIGKKLGEVYKQVDAGGKVKVNTKDLYSSAKQVADELINSPAATTQKRGKDLLQYIDDNFKSVLSEKRTLKLDKDGILQPETITDIGFEDWSLPKLHKWYQDEAGNIKNVLKKGGGTDHLQESIAIEKKKVLGKVIDQLEASVEQHALEAGDVSLKGFKKLKMDFRNVLAAEGIVEKRFHEVGRKDGLGAIQNIRNVISGAISFKGMAAGAALTGGNMPAAILVSTGINAGLASPAAASIGQAGVRSMSRLANWVMKNPNSNIVTDLITAAGVSNTNAFHGMISSAIGKINLMEDPIKRNSEDVRKKLNSILPIIEVEQPEVGSMIRKALSNGDDAAILPLMDSISKLPKAAAFFEEGVGFDGIVYDPKDKAQLSRELLSNTSIPTVQRLQMEKELQNSGVIPDLESVTPRQARQFVPRDKKKHDY